MNRKTLADPTGQAGNRSRALRMLNGRLITAERKIKALFRGIPRTSSRQTQIVNAEVDTVYEYDYDETDLDRAVRFTLNNELLDTQNVEKPFNWYWDPAIELPYRQGTTEEVRDFSLLIAGVVVAGLPAPETSVQDVLLSQEYQKRVTSAKVSGFTSVKGLNDRTANQVLQMMNAGLQAGNTPSTIAAGISERFNVAKSSAKRIAETEINKAYNDAKLDATKLLGKRTGLRAGVIHVSALLPTTRTSHAARHGNAYTVDNQLQWWNSGTNRINCHCSTRSVLIDRSGNVVQSEIQDEIRDQK